VEEDPNWHFGLEAAVNAERTGYCAWEDGVIILHPAFNFGVPSSFVIGDLSIAVRIE
jgi:hypothetical protein